MTILAIDPGKRIGFALFTDSGTELDRGVIDFDNWFSAKRSPIWIHNEGVYWFRDDGESRIDQLVVEGFRHDPNIRQGGSVHWASQIEGSVKTLAALTQTPIAVQYSSILPVAQIIAGYRAPLTRTGKKKHLPDEDSAYLHGMYWLRSRGII